MKTNTKVLLAAIFAVCMFACIAAAAMPVYGHAAAKAVKGDWHVYNQLNDKAKKMYNALSVALSDGTILDGEVDLVADGTVTTDEVKAYAAGDRTLMANFAAARDALMLDNPELFYVNFDAIAPNLGQKGDGYTATLGTSRTANGLLLGFVDKNEANSAKNVFLTKVEELTTQINAAETTVDKITLANKLVCEAANYSFEADGSEAQQAQIRTAYGALVNGYAVCEGYARALKVLLDGQNIASAEVQGYVADDNGGFQPHAWLHVNVDGKWYLVDTTFNDNGNLNYRLLAGSNAAKEYTPMAQVSNGGFEVKYPTLAAADYGKEELKTNAAYSVRENVKWQDITFDYDGTTDAKALRERGLYLVARHRSLGKDGQVGDWLSCFALYEYFDDLFFVNDKVFSTQLLVTSQTPDNAEYGTYTSFDFDKVLATSDEILNDNFKPEGVSPVVKSMIPGANSVLEPTKTYDVSVTYDMDLKLVDENKPVCVQVFSASASDLAEHCKIENAVLLGTDTVRFSLTPSKMYKHDNIRYTFVLNNVVGANGAQPANASLTFARKYVVCGKVFSDDRLYVDAVASPTLVDTSDLSANGFVDSDGNLVSANQRSQLMLVASSVDGIDNAKMVNGATSKTDSGTITSSATYELDLHICGGLTKIPDGSYVKVAFGFPDGFGPEDEGVTFKVFHYKRGADGEIDPALTEEIPCVVTKYGIVVTVNSFSPFMVAAVSGAADSKRNVYATVNTDGGALTSEVTSDGVTVAKHGIVSLSSGESVTYTVAAADGYETDYVVLNGKLTKLDNGKLTLTYDELQRYNTLSVSFVTKAALSRDKANGVTNLNGNFVANQGSYVPDDDNVDDNTDGKTSNATTTVIVCVAVAAVVVAAAAIVVIFLRGRKAKR